MDLKVNISSETINLILTKIGDALGWLCEPVQIKRLAKAEAEAKVIEVKSNIEAKKLYNAYEDRKINQGIKDQKNINNIINKSLTNLDENVHPQDVEDDWISFFFEKCRIVSDERMQDIWAKILAGEFKEPGSFSKRAVNTIELIDKRDADLFTALCSFGVCHGGELWPVINDYKNEIYTNCNLKYETLQHLDDIGLINFNSTTSVELNINGAKTYFSYCGKVILIDFDKTEGNKISTGKITLTETGQQLAKICGANEVDGYFDWLVEYFSSQSGVKVENKLSK